MKGEDGIIVMNRERMKEGETHGKKKLYCFVDLEKAFDSVPREVMRWALRKSDPVKEWLDQTVIWRCTME